MLDIKKLERRWLKYKLKSYAPYFIVLIVIITSLIGSLIWLNTKKPIQPPIMTNKLNIPPKNTTQKTPMPLNDQNTTVLEPSMEFVQSFQNTPIQEDASKSPAVLSKKPVHTQSLPSTPKTLNMPEYTSPPIIPTAVKSTNRDGSLSINRNNENKLDINDLQSRFKETSNANLGLFIARYYYDHGNYDEAYNYALKTNNINNRIDESWILFAKSLVKLGRTDQAKKTLQLYITQSNSETARGLLDAIERGNFK